ncbi:hypothetical protein [Streptomyces sp. S399]|uniref:hypothetical protein n=1 Tax=Streptomyces sp. S399 TaxID=3096009 RepID=UPI0039C115FF
MTGTASAPTARTVRARQMRLFGVLFLLLTAQYLLAETSLGAAAVAVAATAAAGSARALRGGRRPGRAQGAGRQGADGAQGPGPPYRLPAAARSRRTGPPQARAPGAHLPTAA